MSREYSMTVHHNNLELLCTADNRDADDMKVWLYVGDVCKGDYIEVTNILTYLYSQWRVQFRKQFSMEAGA
jgi:hypothetical protein